MMDKHHIFTIKEVHDYLASYRGIWESLIKGCKILEKISQGTKWVMGGKERMDSLRV